MDEVVCKCGARTPEEHLQLVLEGYPVHVFSRTWIASELKRRRRRR